MAIPKEVKHKEKWIKWFSDLGKDSGNVAGGKGANLGEMYNTGVPVPPGFVVTAQAYDYFIKEAGLNEKIAELLERIDYDNTKQLNEITQNIRALITDSKFPKDMKEEILDAYENLDTSGFDMEKGTALDIIKTSSEPIFVAVRSSATTEDLADASFAGQQDTYLNIKGNNPLLDSIKKCFASLFTPRATYYRYKKGFKHSESSLAVIVQKMVDANKSGVIFSKDPSFKNENVIIEAVWGLGEGIVSGRVTPDKYIVTEDMGIKDTKVANKKLAITRDSSGDKSIVKLTESKAKQQVLKNHEIKKLAEIALDLEKHYQKPQDIEFAIENSEIFVVQTRPITTMAKRITEGEERKKIEGEVILEGLAASPGIASGKVKVIEDLKDLDKIRKGDILVTTMTNPDMVVTMQKSAGIITDEGGLTAHAAIVSREMGIPCIVGTDNATTKLKENEVITMDGYDGKIYKGKTAETEKKEIAQVKTETKTKIKVIVDLPSFAERAAKTGIEKVGLTRIEGIIAESGKHPEYFLTKNEMKDYENIIFKGISKIAEHFKELWVRTSDIRTDEFQNLEGAPKEVEANPMLGLHGIRYSVKHPKILKAELNALKRISEQGKTVGLLLPQVIAVDEVQKVKQALKEINFQDARVGVMVETPAAVQIIKDLVDEGIDFISFGTNDLTQYLLAVDRGNEKVQHLYNELHPAILYQLGYVIRVCKRANVETSICGQAGSRKEMVTHLVKNGIDSISVNADMAEEIAKHIAEVEAEIVKDTDKEPRQYQPSENNKKENNKLSEQESKQNNPEQKSQDNQNQSSQENKQISQKQEKNQNEDKKEIKIPMKFNPGTKKYEPDTDKLKESMKNVKENKDNQNSKEESEKGNNEDNDGDENIVKDVDEAVKDIEEEKKEYEKEHPEEAEQEQKQEQKESENENENQDGEEEE
ncbi:phosphoenolpyruvate synthase, partial [Candidatus Pacearchaeota archaeon]|nr:phosphoenolpyruvate synthase [Candidatus Pacearchaeota archaeon]